MDEALKTTLSDAGMTDAIEAIETLEGDLEKEKEARTADETAHEKVIKEKDEIIARKNKDIVGARREYKKLADMTEEERSALSERERELLERQEQLEEDKRKSDEERGKREAKERADTLDRLIEQKVGSNEELAERVKGNIDRIKDAETLTTATELEALVGDAYNMLGEPAPEGVEAVIGFDRGNAPDQRESDFADSQKGKELANRMGLAQSQDQGEQK